jgi:tetraacyldisaccharide 4'-kinase
MFLVRAWYNKAGWLILLRPLSFLFSALALGRRQRQQASQQQAAVPVIVVGNISVGGTGKTPLVLALSQALHERGISTGVLSRGYGGRAPQYPFAVTVDSDVRHSGDEARLLRRHHGGPMWVDPQRRRGLQALIDSHQCDVVISDDGLQHYRLWRDIEIAVVDGTRGLGNGWCLPAGPLREPPARLTQVDYIVINGANRALNEDALSAGETPVTTMRLVPEYWVNVKTGARAELQSLPVPTALSQDIHALAGIGNPQRFFDSLQDLGWQAQCHAYDDHQKRTPSNASRLRASIGGLWWSAQNLIRVSAKPSVIRWHTCLRCANSRHRWPSASRKHSSNNSFGSNQINAENKRG